MDRRKFIKNTASFATLPLLINGQAIRVLGANLSFNPDITEGKVLVLVQLDGGNDGLNTLIPLDRYDNLAKVRPNVVLPENKILPVTQKQGLHPAMAEMQNLYTEEKLMFIQNVGYPQPNLSHFRSKEIYLSASDSQTVISSGWFGRYLEMLHPGYPEGYPSVSFPHPLAVTVGNSSSPTCQGEMTSLGVVLQNLNTSYQSHSGTQDFPETPFGYELKYITKVMQSTEKYLEVVSQAAEVSENLSPLYPGEGENKLADQLKVVARLIAGGLSTPLYIVTLGGFDTHASQVVAGATETGKHAELLQTLSQAVNAFQDDLRLNGKEDQVIGMIYSEFGRRIASNKSDGTDHGAAYPIMLFGSQINPVVYGENPEIPEEVAPSANVSMQTDFRSVYASILHSWFEMDYSEVNTVLFRDFEIIPILKSNVQVADKYYETKSLKIMPVYPNPVTSSAKIQFATQGGYVTLKVYNLYGQEIETLVDDRLPRGSRFAVFQRKRLRRGNYFLVLQNGLEKVTMPFTIQ